MLDSVAGGLYFCNARYYDRVLGRFTQADTIVPEPGHPQALNRYSYVLNNPLRFIDDSGEIAIDIVGGGGGGGGAGMAGVMLASGLAQTVGQQVSALTVRMAPAANATGQTWSLTGNQVIAAGDQLSQAAQHASQAGNTADPGGLDPNDPWDKFNRLLGQGKSEIDAAVEASTQGSGDRFVIGPYNTPTGTLNYIKEAINAGGKYFDAESKLWNQLEQKGLAGQVNRQVIYEQMKAGIGRIELSSGLTIDTVLQTMKESWTAQEVVWIEELAQRFGYVRNMTNTGWMKTP